MSKTANQPILPSFFNSVCFLLPIIQKVIEIFSANQSAIIYFLNFRQLPQHQLVSLSKRVLLIALCPQKYWGTVTTSTNCLLKPRSRSLDQYDTTGCVPRTLVVTVQNEPEECRLAWGSRTVRRWTGAAHETRSQQDSSSTSDRQSKTSPLK